MKTQEIILRDSPEAASYRENICGWVSRDGRERSARFTGCTHVPCEECGEVTEKRWTHCEACRDRRRHERWLKRPVKGWDGDGMVHSEKLNKYFTSMEEVEEAREEYGNDLELVICEPVKLSKVTEDYWLSELETEDGPMELPQEVADALDKLNAALDHMSPVTWTPGRFRADEFEIVQRYNDEE